jgi:tRNA nucleotidyltransferase (CCA-adding enzyme)
VGEVKVLPKKLEVPEAVVEITRRLEDNGFETWTVGGAVRDALLGEYRSDWDLATAARPEAVRKLFRPSYPIGLQFGTVGVRGSDDYVYEVTTFRRDIETDGRHAVVEYADELEDDLARRDFTVNAIAYHAIQHKFRDPFSGKDDLNARLLRCVGDPAMRFAEDYLRVLRGLRFAGRFQLEIVENTWDALTAAVRGLPKLSGERVREETLKVLASLLPSSSLDLYRKSGAVGVTFPGLENIDETAWHRLLRSIDALPSWRLRLRLTMLFAPVGDGIESMMTRLRFSNAEIRDVLALRAAIELPLPHPGDVITARYWLRAVDPGRARDTLRLHAAEAVGSDGGPSERVELAEKARLILNVIRRGDPVTVGNLAIDGNDLKQLGLQPGPEFARILETCLDMVIEDPDLNQRAKLIETVREWL